MYENGIIRPIKILKREAGRISIRGGEFGQSTLSAFIDILQ
jgi:hypothetical protein